MNLTPWALWDRYTGLPSEGAATLEAKEVLERALDRPGGRVHPGLVHLYVHLMEMSPFPEQALPVADQLRSLVPDAGHLVHMPTHIDVLCGDYKSTLEWNLRAIEVNEKYVAREGQVGFYALYHATTAISRSTARCSSAARRSRCASPPTSRPRCPRSCCGSSSRRWPTTSRRSSPCACTCSSVSGCGRTSWRCRCPPTPGSTATTTAMTYYAQGVAHAATGRIAEAEAAREAFAAAVARVPDSRYLFNNTCQDILAVAGAMLDGELEYRRDRYGARPRSSACAADHARQLTAVRRGCKDGC